MTNFQLWQALVTIGLAGGLSAWSVNAEELAIVFDNRPQTGIPPDARAQARRNLTTQKEAPTAKDYPLKFHTLTAETIKSVRIRYFNKKTWASEKEVREYVTGFFSNKTTEVYGFPVWSQVVGVPEIECIVEYTDEYRRSFSRTRKNVAKVGCSSGIRSLAFETLLADGIL